MALCSNIWTYSEQQESSASVCGSGGGFLWEKSSFQQCHSDWSRWGSPAHSTLRAFSVTQRRLADGAKCAGSCWHAALSRATATHEEEESRGQRRLWTARTEAPICLLSGGTMLASGWHRFERGQLSDCSPHAHTSRWRPVSQGRMSTIIKKAAKQRHFSKSGH